MANAVRTRDLLNHNQMLYLLSYGHHRNEEPIPFNEPNRYPHNRKELYMIILTFGNRRVANGKSLGRTWRL